jgi:hypothetical protein
MEPCEATRYPKAVNQGQARMTSNLDLMRMKKFESIRRSVDMISSARGFSHISTLPCALGMRYYVNHVQKSRLNSFNGY